MCMWHALCVCASGCVSGCFPAGGETWWLVSGGVPTLLESLVGRHIQLSTVFILIPKPAAEATDAQ